MHLLKKIIINFYKYADLVITFSENNKKFLKNNLKVKNVEVIYNYFPKFSGKKKIKKSIISFLLVDLSKIKILFFLLKIS